MVLQRFKPYPEYKHSGVEWLGHVPASWSTRRLKFVADEPIKNGIGEAGAYDEPSWPRYVRITDIAGPRSLRDDTFKSLPPNLAREAPFEVGDILLAAVGATYGKSYLHATDIGPVCFAGYLVRFSAGPNVDAGYAAYWTESAAYWAQVHSRVVQATVQNFSAARYRELIIPLPSTDEQRTIATFLDRETAKIDALVAKNERLIDLLQEKRTALITRAVTKGLDPSVPMKDSGVEWLGEIPAHWEVKRLKRLVPQITVGIVVTPSKYYVDEGVPCLRSLNIAQGSVDKMDLVFISPAANELHRKSQVFEGDVVVVRTGRAGTAAIIPDEFHGTNCIDLLIIRRSEQIHSRFLYHFINSRATSAQVEAYSVGAIQEHYNTGTLSNLCVPEVPREEQRAIAAFLDRETAKIDALVTKVRDAIDRLKELRTALISAAVTGKIDVRAA